MDQVGQTYEAMNDLSHTIANIAANKRGRKKRNATQAGLEDDNGAAAVSVTLAEADLNKQKWKKANDIVTGGEFTDHFLTEVHSHAQSIFSTSFEGLRKDVLPPDDSLQEIMNRAHKVYHSIHPELLELPKNCKFLHIIFRTD